MMFSWPVANHRLYKTEGVVGCKSNKNIARLSFYFKLHTVLTMCWCKGGNIAYISSSEPFESNILS